MPPLSPELDWSGCVYVVSEARIVDLLRLLRGIGLEGVIKRQMECRRLFNGIVNSRDREIAMAMQIWMKQIWTALKLREDIKALNQNI